MTPIHVVMVSKALVVGAYQRKAEEIAQRGVALTVLTPPAWGDRRGQQRAERQHTVGYDLHTIPVRFNGNFHLHYYPTLRRELARLRPHILHMDEEPYNFATFLGLRAAAHQGIQPLFFTWQNLYRRYPPPFLWMEKYNYRHARFAIAGNQEAADVLRRKGYTGDVSLIPQFGVDPAFFCPDPAANAEMSHEEFVIGYAGGLLPEKGIDLLIHACAGLRGRWRLRLVGSGSEENELQALARTLNVADQVTIEGRRNSMEMPGFYRTLDALVLPSRTTPRWQEQFGRVLIEAMACEVPVIGSDSGEIPNVIGESGWIFPEGDVSAMRQLLQRLLDDPGIRLQLGKAGRKRVLERYTMGRVAEQTVALYRRMLQGNEGKPFQQ